jgi:hypothetical protein
VYESPAAKLPSEMDGRNTCTRVHAPSHLEIYRDMYWVPPCGAQQLRNAHFTRCPPLARCSSSSSHAHARIHTHTHTRIYIYIYICACMRVRACERASEREKRDDCMLTRVVVSHTNHAHTHILCVRVCVCVCVCISVCRQARRQAETRTHNVLLGSWLLWALEWRAAYINIGQCTHHTHTAAAHTATHDARIYLSARAHTTHTEYAHTHTHTRTHSICVCARVCVLHVYILYIHRNIYMYNIHIPSRSPGPRTHACACGAWIWAPSA